MSDDNPSYIPPPRGSNAAMVIVLGLGLLLGVVCCGGLALFGIVVPVHTEMVPTEVKVPMPETTDAPAENAPPAEDAAPQ